MTATRRSGRKAPPGGARTRMFQMRMNDLEYQRLQAEADLRGVKVADVVRQQLGAFLETAESSGTPEMPIGTVDLAQWLAGRLRLPAGIARRYIQAGRVTVDGRVHRSERATRASLERVALDGESV
jgi:hypothetical protein